MANYTFQQLQQFAQNAGFDPNNAAILAAIGLAESGGNSNAHNPGTASVPENSYGLFQLNLLAHPDISVAQATDPQKAANEAYALYKRAGGSFADWSTYTSGAYKQYLPSQWAPPWQPGNPISGIASIPGNATLGLLEQIPVIKNFLTAPADLGTRIVGTGVGLAIILIGLITVSVTTNRKIINSALGQSATQGAAQGASQAVVADALTDGEAAAVPQATVKEETSPPNPPSPPARRYRTFTRRATMGNSTPQSDDTVEGTVRDPDAPQLRPGRRERVTKAARELFPEQYNDDGTQKKRYRKDGA